MYDRGRFCKLNVSTSFNSYSLVRLQPAFRTMSRPRWCKAERKTVMPCREAPDSGCGTDGICMPRIRGGETARSCLFELPASKGAPKKSTLHTYPSFSVPNCGPRRTVTPYVRLKLASTSASRTKGWGQREGWIMDGWMERSDNAGCFVFLVPLPCPVDPQTLAEPSATCELWQKLLLYPHLYKFFSPL